MSQINENFKKNGVILIKNLVNKKLIKNLSENIEGLYGKPINKSIPKEPIIICWRHNKNGEKSIFPLSYLNDFRTLMYKTELLEILKEVTESKHLQLFETIVFKKPPKSLDNFYWHNDASFFPLDPPNHVSVWIALDECNKETGKLEFAKRSHLEKYNGAPINLKDYESFKKSYFYKKIKNYKIFSPDMIQGDALFFNGYIWHSSKPNIAKNKSRKGLCLRFLTQKSSYMYSEGKSASFVKQILKSNKKKLLNKYFPIFN